MTSKETEQSAYGELGLQIERDLKRVLDGGHELDIWSDGCVYIKFVDGELGEDAWERVYYERIRNTTSIRRVHDVHTTDGVHEHNITVYEAVLGLGELRAMFLSTLQNFEWAISEAKKIK